MKSTGNTIATGGIISLAVLISGVSQAQLINVDWGKGPGGSGTNGSAIQTGAAATGAAGDFWNATDPESNVFTELENVLDSSSTATTVDVTWSDELQSSVNTGAIEFGSTGHNALMQDYGFTAGGTTATVTISELPLSVDYTLYLYGVPDGQQQDTLFTVIGSNEGARHVVMGNVNDDNGLNNPDDYVVFTGNTGGGGQIVYTQTTFSGQQGGFSGSNGFQLQLGAVSTDPPDAPGLVSPDDAATGVSVFSVLEWSVGSGADDYAVYLWKTGDTVPDLENGAPTAEVSALSYDPGGLDPSIEYNWAVTARNAFGNTPSTARTFTTDSGVPLAPALTGPGDAASNQSVFTILEWDAATGATSYEVFLWKSADAMPGTPTATGTDLSYDPVALDAMTEYSWLVKSANTFGATSSATFTFTTGEAPPPSSFDTLINVDWFDGRGGNTVATGAGVVGSAGDIWNATFAEGNNFTDLENLTAADGTATTIDVIWTDELQSSNSTAINFGTALNQLMQDYAFTHPNTTATVTISDLPANAEYTLYLLGVSDSGAQDATFEVVDANQGPQTVTSPDTFGGPVLVTPDDYMVFTGNTGASGEIIYMVTGGANFCGHNGFQLGLTDASVKITSFTPMGGNVWELTLEGANESAYVFYSSPTLEFTPGTLIENLAPGTVPTGTIGGTNNEVLTTDIDGHAAVQVTLAGGPRDFVRAQSAPPLLKEGFETNDGSFTAPVIGGTTEGTLWAWGQPDSNNKVGLAIVDGNPPSLKCWAIGLGAFIATGDGTNEGYYAIPTTAYLRSRPIDLTGVTAASLSFAEAIDAQAGDVAEVYVIDATDAVIGGGPIYDATGGLTRSENWTAANEGTPIALPAGSMGQTVRIEWRFTGAGTDFLGWYIDGVVVERN